MLSLTCTCDDITVRQKRQTELLLKKKIATEMAENELCLCMTSIADTKKGFNKLFYALKKIDKALKAEEKETEFSYSLPTREIYPFEAKALESVYIMPSEAEGKTAGEYIFAYPPGCPIVAPGEIITAELLALLKEMADSGAEIQTSSGKYPKLIKISL